MAPEQRERFVEDFVRRVGQAINSHDADAIAALRSETVVWKYPAAPALLHGRDAVRHFHRTVLFHAIPDVRFELLDGPYLSRDGTRAVVRTRFSGTMTGPLEPLGFAPTGQRVEFETAEFWEFDGNLLARDTVMLDMLALARQVGAVPRSGSVAERIGVVLQRLTALRCRLRRRKTGVSPAA